jgi:hypothetical protein
MPYKKSYTMGNMKKAEMKTPMSVMGSQGTAAKIMPSHYMARPTMTKAFPAKKSK